LELRIRGHFIGWQVAEPMDDNLNGRWAEELQKITGLRNLGFRLYNQRTLQENAAFVRGLGVAMLKNGHLLIDESDVVGLLEMKGGPGGLFLEAFLSTS